MSFNARDIVLGPGEGRAVSVSGLPVTLKAVKRDTGGSIGVVEAVLPDGMGPPRHIHKSEDEAFYVLEGEVEFLIGGRTVREPAGSFVFIPRGTVHSFTNAGASPGRLLAIFTPAGFEGFFEEVDGTLEVAEVRTIAEKYDMEVVGPPLRR